MTACIFASADINDYDAVHIPEGAVIIAADGGYRHCLKLGIKPGLIIGDFDSYTGELPCDCQIVRVPSEKDESDLILAINECIKDRISQIFIYGADGGRMGHTVANIQTLSYMDEKGVDGVIYGSGFDMRVQSAGKKSYYNSGYSYVSVFAVTEKARIAVTGLKYGGDISLTSSFPLGLSNEFTGDSCEINVISGKILVILEK